MFCDLDEAWTLASPTMRYGLTRAGLAPRRDPGRAVPRGRARQRRLARRRAVVRRACSRTSSKPEAGLGQNIIVYSVELSAAGRGAKQRFLVDTWVALGSLGTDVSPMQSRGGSSGRVEPDPLAFDDAGLGPVCVPRAAGIGGLLVIFLLGLGVRGVGGCGARRATALPNTSARERPARRRRRELRGGGARRSRARRGGFLGARRYRSCEAVDAELQRLEDSSTDASASSR